MTERPEKWIEFVREQLLPALKSGEYDQGHGALRLGGESDSAVEDGPAHYCCLGVACDLLIKGGDDRLAWVQTAGADRSVAVEDRRHEGKNVFGAPLRITDVLPAFIASEFGVSPQPVLYRLDDSEWCPATVSLIDLNDEDESYQFKDVIEALEGALDPSNTKWFFTYEEALEERKAQP